MVNNSSASGISKETFRILYHHRTRGDGAEGVHISEMINAFRDLGHEVECCCPRTARRPPGLSLGMTGMSAADSQGLVGAIKLAVRQFVELAYNLVSFVRLMIAMCRFRPDFIYERYSCYLFAGVLAAKLCRIPLVLEVNSTYAGRFKRRKLAFSNICRGIENFALRNSTVVAVVSGPLRNCVLDRKVDQRRVVITPNAVNERTVRGQVFDCSASRAQLGINQESIVIGFVGSLRRWHGVDILASAIPKVLQLVPSSVFLIVGSGELELELKRLKSMPPVGERLILTGGVPHSEVNGLVAAIDIGLMPHSNDWGSPMKILEYMSLGKLCIAPQLAPIEELLQNGVTGVLFPPGDEDAFVAAIVKTCDNCYPRDVIGARAREFVLRERRWTDNARTVLGALATV